MPSANRQPRTLYDKVLQDHIVDEREDGTLLLYIGETVKSTGMAYHMTDGKHQIDISFMK